MVGIDLCDDITQIAVFNTKTYETELIGVTDDNQDAIIETSISMPSSNEILRRFISSIRNEKVIIIDGKPVDEMNLLAYYFRKTLSLTKKEYPGELILQLVITIEIQEKNFVNKIYEALNRLGIGRDRATVIDHKQSYLYFTLSQEKEIWLNDVGMFEYSDKGLFYYQMNIDRHKSPILVGVTKRDYTEMMNVYHPEEGESKKSAVFENIVRSAIHRQVISTLYMTGNGFDGEWSREVLQKLCVGRRVFIGKNLYVSGACYAARELSGKGKLEEFVFLDDDMIQAHITMNVYAGAKNQEMILAKAGTPWYQVEKEIDLIPNGEEELTLTISHVLHREMTEHMISLEGIRGRTNRMSRIGVRIKFIDVKTCVVTIKDKGFGELMPSSNRIWERTIMLK